MERSKTIRVPLAFWEDRALVLLNTYINLL